MSKAELSRKSVIDTSMDTVIIALLLEDIPGGRTLDVSAVTDEVIKGGHVLIEETSTGEIKPLGITGESYDTLPAGHTYKGVLTTSILKAKPLAPIMVRGRYNTEAAINAGLPAIPAAAATALKFINFTKD